MTSSFPPPLSSTASRSKPPPSSGATPISWALLDGEIRARHNKRVALNLQSAKFPYLKRIEDFDFTAQSAVDRRLVDKLATGRCLAECRSPASTRPDMRRNGGPA
ncbi:MAG TPA: ATP-binding protein [Burkholderiaceae bacterium]|nr:ATP-binding protein [Burkholderiaceae bacterium]